MHTETRKPLSSNKVASSVSSTSSTQRGTCTVSPSHGRHRAWHLPIAYPPRISLKSTMSSGNSSISAKRSKCKQQRPGCADPSGSICTRRARWLGHNRTSSPPYRPKIRAAGAAPGARPHTKEKGIEGSDVGSRQSLTTLALPVPVLVVLGTRLSSAVEKRFHSRLAALTANAESSGHTQIYWKTCSRPRAPPCPPASRRHQTDTAANAAGVHVLHRDRSMPATGTNTKRRQNAHQGADSELKPDEDETPRGGSSCQQTTAARQHWRHSKKPHHPQSCPPRAFTSWRARQTWSRTCAWPCHETPNLPTSKHVQRWTPSDRGA